MYATGDKIKVFFDVEAGVLTFSKNAIELDGQIRNVAYTQEQLAGFKVPPAFRTRQLWPWTVSDDDDDLYLGHRKRIQIEPHPSIS